MLNAIIASGGPILTLFICMGIGFALRKTNIIDDSGASSIAKLETWVFCPALSFVTMARFSKPHAFAAHGVNLLVSVSVLFVSITLALLLIRFFFKERCYERGVYLYALTFANTGYFGDPVVLGVFGEEALAYYKIFCLPISIAIYTWGLSLFKKNEAGANPLKKLLNPPTVATLIGIAVGLILPDFDAAFPSFLVGALDALKACMGPLAMILAGLVIGKYDFLSLIKTKRVYAAAMLRLFILPVVSVSVAYIFNLCISRLLGTAPSNIPIYLALIATASPLGLNTVVFPEAYGESPRAGASMALVSHTLAVITVPLMLALCEMIFGKIMLLAA